MAKKSFSNDLLRDLHSESLIIDLVPTFSEPIELSALGSDEKVLLNECESIIEKGFNTFTEVGNALFEIRNNKLYRENHTTFEDYCKQKWQIKRQRAYELMDAAGIVNTLSEISDKTETSKNTLNIKESHAAALGKIPVDIRGEVWQEAIKEQQSTGKVITAKYIQTIYSNIQGVDDYSEENQKMEERNKLVKKIREKVKYAKLGQIALEIKGSFIIENDLVEVWQKLRNDFIEINANDKIYLSLEQAEVLGLIRKM